MTAPQHRRSSPAPVDSFDAQIDQEWREFRAELADVVATLNDFDTVVVRVVGGGVDPSSMTKGVVQVDIELDLDDLNTVLMTVPRNARLAPHTPPLTRRQLAAVRALAPNRWSDERWYWFAVPRTHCDQVADMTVRYLRDIIGVTSPTLLHTTMTVPNDGRWLKPWREHSREISLVEGLTPVSEHHLHRLMVEALTDSFELESEDDGDVVIITAGRLMWAWPSLEAGHIRLATLVTDDLPDPEEALPLVNELGFRCEGTKLFVKGQKLVAFRDVLVVPFFAAALVDQVHDLTATTEQLAEHLPQHLGAARQAWCGGDTDPGDWPSLG